MSQPFSLLFFVFAVVLLNVVVMNALIAVLADSYERVQENSAIHAYKEKLHLISNLRCLMLPWRREYVFRPS